MPHGASESGPARLSEYPGGFYNLLEPPRLIDHFLAVPPKDFATFRLRDGVPAFSTSFDLLTTADPAVKHKLDGLPFARRWRPLLCARTCFIGTTVSEYALFPRAIPPGMFVREVLQHATRYAFVIVKDIPTDPVLVGAAGYDYSRRFATACREAGFVLVEGQALGYVPIDFASIDEFLARMSRARRKDVRRKLLSRAQLEIQVIPSGDVLFRDEAMLAELYALYVNVYRQSEIHFDLLSAAFFRTLLQDTGSGGIVFVYRAGGQMIGYNICFVNNENLVDKYIGFLYPRAQEYNLYTVSWFHNLEYALARGLRCYIAGWTDPEVKRHLGACFTLTQHAVYVRNIVLRKALIPLKRFFESDHRWHAEAHASNADS